MTETPLPPDDRAAARRRGLLILCAVLPLVFAAEPALAQAIGQLAGQGGAKPTPFGLGAPTGPGGGLTGFILAQQAEFYRALVKAVRAAKADGHAAWMLAGLSFAYGVFHAAGPGHGKAVISSYLLADGGTLKRGAALALAAGLVQALTAVVFVGLLAVVLGATAVTMAGAMNVVEIVAYGGIAAFGAYLAYGKGRNLVAAWRGTPAHVHGPDCGCGDSHAPDPRLLDGTGGLRRAAVAVLSAGARPCSGAILVLTFALAQGVFATGVLSAFAMGLGTALTVTAIAALAVYGKRLAVGLAVMASGRGSVLLAAIELGAALLVCAFGLALLTGYLSSERLLPG